MSFGNRKRKKKGKKLLLCNTQLNYRTRKTPKTNIPFIHDDSQGVIKHTSISGKKRDDTVIEVQTNTVIRQGILKKKNSIKI